MLYLGEIGALAQRQLPRVMVRLLVRRLSFIAHFEDLGVGDGLVETGHDHLVAQDRARALGVRLADGVADPLGRRPLLLAFDFANGLDEPFLPNGLARRPGVWLASFPHHLIFNAKDENMMELSKECFDNMIPTPNDQVTFFNLKPPILPYTLNKQQRIRKELDFEEVWPSTNRFEDMTNPALSSSFWRKRHCHR